MCTTIDDVYTEYLARCGVDSPGQTVEDIRAVVQASVGRYELVDEEWWDGLDGAWLAGVGQGLPWLDHDEWNDKYEWLQSLRLPWLRRLPKPGGVTL